MIDTIIIISLAISLIGGFIKGFILSLAGLVGWILGIVLSFRFAGLIQDYLTQVTGYDSHYM